MRTTVTTKVVTQTKTKYAYSKMHQYAVLANANYGMQPISVNLNIDQCKANHIREYIAWLLS